MPEYIPVLNRDHINTKAGSFNKQISGDEGEGQIPSEFFNGAPAFQPSHAHWYYGNRSEKNGICGVSSVRTPFLKEAAIDTPEWKRYGRFGHDDGGMQNPAAASPFMTPANCRPGRRGDNYTGIHCIAGKYRKPRVENPPHAGIQPNTKKKSYGHGFDEAENYRNLPGLFDMN